MSDKFVMYSDGERCALYRNGKLVAVHLQTRSALLTLRALESGVPVIGPTSKYVSAV